MELTYPNLNLPLYGGVKLEKKSDVVRVYDFLRKKWLVLTPEEWVRQHFVEFLIHGLGYPSELIGNEISLKHNGLTRRCDTIVYSRTLKPLAVIEYKAPDVEITERVFDQIARYNLVLDAKILIVSNGMKHYCCKLRSTEKKYFFLDRIPSYSELIELE